MTSEAPTAADFSKVSVRTLVAYLLLFGFCTYLLFFAVLPAEIDSVWPVLIVIFLLYGVLLFWALRHCSHAGSDLRHLLGPPPIGPDWKPLAVIPPFYLLVAGVIMLQDILLAQIWPHHGSSPIRDMIAAQPFAKVTMGIITWWYVRLWKKSFGVG